MDVPDQASIPGARVEGHAKVTGTAKYTGDLGAVQIGASLLHAVVVQSDHAAGRVVNIDTAPAERTAGVRAVITHLNAPRLKRVKTLLITELDCYLPLQDDRIRYNGQPLAVVVAQELVQAQYAASLISVQYEEAQVPPVLCFGRRLKQAEEVKKVGAGDPAVVRRGKPDRAFASASIQFEQTYATPPEHHNAIEPGATVAAWDKDGRLTVRSATQFAYGDAIALAQAFGFGARDGLLRLGSQIAAGLEMRSDVRVIVPFVGGGFGGKGTNAHMVIAAMAAKVAGAPVKLVLTREQTYPLMPYRPAVVQHLKIGATRDGRISAILHDCIVQGASTSTYVEPSGEMTPHLYECANLRMTHKLVKLDVNGPSWMRAPGAASGMFSLECAVDELAEALGLDPVEIRVRNHADVDPQSGKAWSSKSLRECYGVAGERIGWWSERDPHPWSMQEDGWLVGYGMATAAYRTMQFPSTARVVLTSEGDAVLQSAAHEIGQGAITALTQIGAEELGLPVERVRLEWGDTKLPFAAMAGGSSTTLSVGSAIKAAAEKLKLKLAVMAVVDRRSPLYGLSSRDVGMNDGRLFLRTDPRRGEPFTSVLSRRGQEQISAKAVTGRLFGRSQFGRCAFGAQFVKLRVHPETGEIQLQRLIGAFGAGRIVNPKLARSQLLGGMVWGAGQALWEGTVLDERVGRWVNSNLAEALVPTNSDIPQTEALLVEEN